MIERRDGRATLRGSVGHAALLRSVANRIPQWDVFFTADTMTGDFIRQTVAITNPAGFHMRPMQAFVETAIRFPCTVTVTRLGKPPVNGKSILGLLGLVAEQGAELQIEVSGPDAANAMQELVAVFERSYDEG